MLLAIIKKKKKGLSFGNIFHILSRFSKESTALCPKFKSHVKLIYDFIRAVEYKEYL